MQNLTDPSSFGANTGGCLQGLVDSCVTPSCNLVSTSDSTTQHRANPSGEAGGSCQLFSTLGPANSKVILEQKKSLVCIEKVLVISALELLVAWQRHSQKDLQRHAIRKQESKWLKRGRIWKWHSLKSEAKHYDSWKRKCLVSLLLCLCI